MENIHANTEHIILYTKLHIIYRRNNCGNRK